jgi:hypothetical protein
MDKLVGDASTKCKEAGGAWDGIIHDEDDNKDDDKDDKDNNKDKAKDSGNDPVDEDDAKPVLLHREMDSLEHRMYSEGTVASVFARAVTQARLAGQPFGDDAVTSIAAIFEGSENPNPCAVAAALEPDAVNARAYLIVMNIKVGFTLLHHLQLVDQEIWPGDPIATKTMAFEGDIRPQGPTPNVVVFNEAKDTLFQQFNLPPACLVKTFAKYRQANRNDQHHTFVVEPSVTARITGVVTRMIPIPMEWVSMFVNGPNFGTAFSRVFDLFDSLEEENWTALYPILEMIGVACCTANNSAMPPSTLSTQWTCLTYHARTKRWAAEAWARHLDPVKQAPPDPEDPCP